MELKAKLIPRWAASILDCLKHLHQPQRQREKRWYRERKRDEADELGLMELKAKPIPR